MTRVSLLMTAAFFAGLGLGVRGAGTNAAPLTETRATDLAAIEKLHNADIEATLAQDLSALIVCGRKTPSNSTYQEHQWWG
jgi:hypothetical protein